MKKKQIVFIEPYPMVMNYKIARLLKKKGYETIMIRILKPNKEGDGFYNDAYTKIIDINMEYAPVNKKNFLKIGWLALINSKNIFLSFLKIKKLKPHIIFGRAPLSTPLVFFRLFFRKYPFVYFPYDIRTQAFSSLEEGMKYLPAFEIKAERWCFEHSDGILHKGGPIELNFLNGRMLGENILLPKHEIMINPYCSKEFIIPFNKNKLSQKDNEIHMVYIGGTGKRSEDFYFGQFKSVEKIVKEGIHAHFYFCSDLSDKKGLKTEGTVKTEEEIKENFYEKYKKEPFIKYFHLEKSFDPKGIVKEISKYDFGFWPECEFDVKLATGNKFSTFIEAGIPFFYFQTHEFTDKQAKDYGLHVLRADNVKNFKKKIEELNYDKLIESLKEARKDYLMEKHLPRLEKFIKDVVQEKRNKK